MKLHKISDTWNKTHDMNRTNNKNDDDDNDNGDADKDRSNNQKKRQTNELTKKEYE